MVKQAYRERYANVLDKQYFNFAAAHFLVFEDGTREPLHGHNYHAEIEIEAASLDDAALVADFIVVKPLFKAACDALDHRVLLPSANRHVRVWTTDEQVHVACAGARFSFPREDVVLLDADNTSSELLAKALCEDVLSRIHDALPGLALERAVVTVSESPGQAARYERTYLHRGVLQATHSDDTPHLKTAGAL